MAGRSGREGFQVGASLPDAALEVSESFVGVPVAEIATWHRRVVSDLLRMGASLDVSEDLASEAVLRLWTALKNGAAPCSREAYLRRIGRNLYVDHIRREVRDRSRMAALMTREVMKAVGNVNHHAAAVFAVVVRDARSRLPRRYQQVLVCTIDLDMGLREIAFRLGLPSERAAATLAHRARRALIEALLDLEP